MSQTNGQAAANDGHATQNLILTVSQSGSVSSVVEAPSAVREQFAQQPESLEIDQLWNDKIVVRIRSALRKAILSRASGSIEVDNPDGSVQEMLFVPQGTDRILMIVRDLTDQKRHQRLAYTDEVTGLPNRDFLLAELAKITEVQRLKEGRCATISIHVGQFDEYGYAMSSAQQDEVLAQLASRLKAHLRGSNKPNMKDYERYSVVSRTDYRQFCVVLPSIESGEDAEAVAERLVADLQLPVSIENRVVTVSAHGGIALFPQDGTDPIALFENAIAAMEDARSLPTSGVKFHSGTVRLRTLQRIDLEAELKAALDNDDYDLNFLPIVNAQTGTTESIEALLRWPDAVLGAEPTRKIIRVAERTGLILPIGRWVLRKACERLQQWRANGHADLRVTVNLSAQEFVSDGLVDSIEQILKETGTDPTSLDIEIKEHVLFREVQSRFPVCDRLKSIGVRLVVDDYGVGTCSLAHLSQSPIDAIKIDNSFSAHIDTRERDKAAFAAALAMADALGVDVIAEGIETELQANALRELGCRFLQGFWISQPLASSDVQAFLDASSQTDGIKTGGDGRL